MANDDQRLKTGTTTMGIVCKDGVVILADKRVSVGHSFNVGSAQKILPVGKRFVLSIAGTVSDALMLTKHLRSEIRLKELQSGNEVTVKEAANLLGQYVYHHLRSTGAIIHFLFGGVDSTGTYLYDVYLDGTTSQVDAYQCTGSGMVYAYGVLDADYNSSITTEKGIELAKKALGSSLQRDLGSGNGFDVVVIKQDGIEEKDAVIFEKPLK